MRKKKNKRAKIRKNEGSKEVVSTCLITISAESTPNPITEFECYVNIKSIQEEESKTRRVGS